MKHKQGKAPGSKWATARFGLSYQLLERFRCKKDGKHLLEDITGKEHTESLQQFKATKTTEGQPDRLPLITDPNIKQLPEMCCGNKLKKYLLHSATPSIQLYPVYQRYCTMAVCSTPDTL